MWNDVQSVGSVFFLVWSFWYATFKRREKTSHRKMSQVLRWALSCSSSFNLIWSVLQAVSRYVSSLWSETSFKLQVPVFTLVWSLLQAVSKCMHILVWNVLQAVSRCLSALWSEMCSRARSACLHFGLKCAPSRESKPVCTLVWNVLSNCKCLSALWSKMCSKPWAAVCLHFGLKCALEL